MVEGKINSFGENYQHNMFGVFRGRGGSEELLIIINFFIKILVH